MSRRYCPECGKGAVKVVITDATVEETANCVEKYDAVDGESEILIDVEDRDFVMSDNSTTHYSCPYCGHEYNASTDEELYEEMVADSKLKEWENE